MDGPITSWIIKEIGRRQSCVFHWQYQELSIQSVHILALPKIRSWLCTWDILWTKYVPEILGGKHDILEDLKQSTADM